MLPTLMKNSKRNYFTRFFENNSKNLKNTWKGIKSRISMKGSSSNSPMLLTYENNNVDNPERIANNFNNYFSTIGEKTQATIKLSRKPKLITSQKKILTHFSFHQLTKKKLKLLSPL